MPFAPGRKFRDRPSIGFPSIRVSNVGGEEFHEPLSRVGRRCEKGGEFPRARYYYLHGVFLSCSLLNSSV